MNKIEKQKIKHVERSQLSRKLIIRYLLALGVYFVMVFLLLFVLVEMSFNVTWYEDSTLYQILKWIQKYILPVGILIGFVAITYYNFRKPLQYLDEVIAASQSLTAPTGELIVLSAPLREVEHEMNLIREQALRNAQAAQAEEQRKNDLIVYLAHDLKTPLTSVIGYLTLLRDEQGISPEARAQYTGIALDKSVRLEELINEFFDITRFSLSHLELAKTPINLTRVLEQLAFDFKAMFAEKDMGYQLHLPEKLEFNCDADKMSRVFDNLLKNAYHYSTRGSVVEITGEQTTTGITLTFTNTGMTIPQEKLDRLFEQFFRLDSARISDTGGSGLGLAIAKEIVTLHGGTIEAQSNENMITFILEFPTISGTQGNLKNFT